MIPGLHVELASPRNPAGVELNRITGPGVERRAVDLRSVGSIVAMAVGNQVQRAGSIDITRPMGPLAEPAARTRAIGGKRGSVGEQVRSRAIQLDGNIAQNHM